ncbi:hypothetical protein AB0D04_33865 [Streptomyces sp. NPDC048483]|uniref:hypothetical protein n=1 Tax=Streptomyces sp. NPDC048483 TaxID=3154927 RepID=UPI00342FE67D
MGSSEEYFVDLEALDTVGRKLNGVLRSMEQAKSKTGHSTYLPKGTLGQGFKEENELNLAHDQMKAYIEDNILKLLQDLIHDLSEKTKKTKDAYHDREYDVTNALNPGGK